MSDEKNNKERPEWRKTAAGLYVPQGTPEGGKKPTVGFARVFGEKSK